MNEGAKVKSEEITVNKELMTRLLHFVANANNTLMNIPVQGDLILASAKIMNEAQVLAKELQGYE